MRSTTSRPPPTGSTGNQFGGTLGGPIKRNSMFVFGALQ